MLAAFRGWLRGDAELQPLRRASVDDRASLPPHAVSSFATWRAVDAVAQVFTSLFLFFGAGLLMSTLAPHANSFAFWLVCLVCLLLVLPSSVLGPTRLAQRIEKRRLRAVLTRLALPAGWLRGLGTGSSIAIGTDVGADVIALEKGSSSTERTG
jgi:hypothetical protein